MLKWLLNDFPEEKKPIVCDNCGKILYSRKEAGYLINEMHGRHGMRRYTGKVPVRLYSCIYNSGFYHVTSRRFNPEVLPIKAKKKNLENVV